MVTNIVNFGEFQLICTCHFWNSSDRKKILSRQVFQDIGCNLIYHTFKSSSTQKAMICETITYLSCNISPWKMLIWAFFGIFRKPENCVFFCALFPDMSNFLNKIEWTDKKNDIIWFCSQSKTMVHSRQRNATGVSVAGVEKLCKKYKKVKSIYK